jgi:hypothetical protein
MAEPKPKYPETANFILATIEAVSVVKGEK